MSYGKAGLSREACYGEGSLQEGPVLMQQAWALAGSPTVLTGGWSLREGPFTEMVSS